MASGRASGTPRRDPRRALPLRGRRAGSRRSVGAQEAGDAVQHRRLAAARCAKGNDEIAVANRQVDGARACSVPPDVDRDSRPVRSRSSSTLMVAFQLRAEEGPARTRPGPLVSLRHRALDPVRVTSRAVVGHDLLRRGPVPSGRRRCRPAPCAPPPPPPSQVVEACSSIVGKRYSPCRPARPSASPRSIFATALTCDESAVHAAGCRGTGRPPSPSP